MSMPFEGTLAEWRLFGQASHLYAPSRVIVIGVWIIVGVSMVPLPLSFSGWSGRTTLDHLGFVLGYGVWLVLMLLVAVRTTRHRRRALAAPPSPDPEPDDAAADPPP